MSLLLQTTAAFTKAPLAINKLLVSTNGPAALSLSLNNKYRFNSTTANKPRGRETIRFPFVWPAEANKIPDHSLVKPLRPKQLSAKITNWFLNKSSMTMFKQIFSEKYRQDMQEKMAGMALRAMIEAINSKDFARIDDICSPHIAKMYKHALSHLDAQKCRLQVSAQTAGTPKIGGFMFKTGPPEAFDPSVPFATRFERYGFRFNNWRRFAAAKKLPSNKEGTLIPSILKEFSDTRLSVDVWCMVPVSVKIELWKNNGLLDSDQGNMTIPLTLSSPVYDDLLDITSAVAQFEDSDNLEPFRWSISDIFFIVDSREISQIYQCYMKAKDDLSSGNQE